MATFTLVISLRRISLAIRPAGSSLPVLIRRPVLSRVRASCKEAFERARDFCVLSEGTFVLMRVMSGTSPYKVCAPASLVLPRGAGAWVLPAPGILFQRFCPRSTGPRRDHDSVPAMPTYRPRVRGGPQHKCLSAIRLWFQRPRPSADPSGLAYRTWYLARRSRDRETYQRTSTRQDK